MPGTTTPAESPLISLGKRLGLAFLNLAKPVSLFCLLLLIVRARASLPAVLYLAMALSILLLAWQALPRRSEYRVFAFYFAAFGLFNALRTFADETGNPVNYAYVIHADAIFGAVPSIWLQDHFYTPGKTGPLDIAAVVTYSSYFTVHYVLATGLWWLRRDLLRPFVGAILATLFLGLVGYYLIPTAPPWLASEGGHIPQVIRISQMVSNDLWASAYAQGTYIAGTNDVAAMPSLHTALTGVVAMACWRIGRVAGLIGWLYVAMMGFSLVYTGEHYIIDCLAGLVTASIAWRLTAALQTRSSLASTPRPMTAPARGLEAMPDQEAA